MSADSCCSAHWWVACFRECSWRQARDAEKTTRNGGERWGTRHRHKGAQAHRQQVGAAVTALRSGRPAAAAG